MTEFEVELHNVQEKVVLCEHFFYSGFFSL